MTTKKKPEAKLEPKELTEEEMVAKMQSMQKQKQDSYLMECEQLDKRYGLTKAHGLMMFPGENPTPVTKIVPLPSQG